MSIVQIEATSAQSSGAIARANFGTATIANELIVIMAGGLNGGALPTIADSASQTYTPIGSVSISGGFSYGLWYKEGSGSGVTSATADPGANRTFIIAAHYTGITASSSLDQSTGPASDGTSPWNSASVTTTAASELLVGCCFATFGTANAVISASGAWGQDVEIPSGVWDNNNGNDVAFAHQIVSSIQTNIQNTGTNSASTAGTAYPGIATFKAASGDLLINMTADSTPTAESAPHPGILESVGVIN